MTYLEVCRIPCYFPGVRRNLQILGQKLTILESNLENACYLPCFRLGLDSDSLAVWSPTLGTAFAF